MSEDLSVTFGVFWLVVNEAMAAGCAVVVSDDVGAHSDLVTNGQEGFVYPVGNVPALAEALAQVLPGLAARLMSSACCCRRSNPHRRWQMQ